MLFHEIDHGGWLSKFGINRRMVRWIFGNPLIAITMIRHDLTAGLFARSKFSLRRRKMAGGL